MGVGAGLYMCDVVVKSSRSLSHLLMSSCIDSGLQTRSPTRHEHAVSSYRLDELKSPRIMLEIFALGAGIVRHGTTLLQVDRRGMYNGDDDAGRS